MLYTESHEWVEIQGGVATVGVTDFAQKELGEIVHVELPELGRWIQEGEEAAVLESTKAAADVYSPVRGEIIEVNERLLVHAELVNESPTKNGWLFKVKLDKERPVPALLDETAYLKLIEEGNS